MLVIVSTVAIAYKPSILYYFMCPDHLYFLRLLNRVHKSHLIIAHLSQLRFLVDQLSTIYPSDIMMFSWRMIEFLIISTFMHTLFILPGS